MSTIDRRAFFVGCLAVPLAGCNKPTSVAFSGGSSAAQCDTSPHGASFLNAGCWKNIGNSNTGDTWVFVVTPS
jgi:hypothetical protein